MEIIKIKPEINAEKTQKIEISGWLKWNKDPHKKERTTVTTTLAPAGAAFARIFSRKLPLTFSLLVSIAKINEGIPITSDPTIVICKGINGYSQPKIRVRIVKNSE